MLCRREFLAVAGALALPRANAAIADPIAQYDSQGIHRTGTAVDRASADWLAGLVKSCGLKPQLEPFRLSRVDPQACFVEAGGRRVDGLPMFDGSFTDHGGIRGRIGAAGSDAPIGWLEAPPNGEAGELLEIRKSGRHKAIIVVTKGAVPGLSPINAAQFAHPMGPPVLQISSEERGWISELAGAKTDALVTAQVQRTDVEAFNVTAVRKGRDSKLPSVVVMTPRSGWWQCASERGGGLVCWLELMRAIREPARDFVFVASSGHELGHLGLDSFIEKNSGLVKGARAWLHFGANIGAKEPGGVLQCSGDAMESLATRELGGAGITLTPQPRGRVPGGEAGNIHKGGGQYISVIGRNAFFHNQADRWPDAVDTIALAKFVSAFVNIAKDLEKTA